MSANSSESILFFFGIVLILLLILVFVFLARMFDRLRRIEEGKILPTNLEPQIAVLAEKIAHIEPVVQAVNTVQTEMRGLTERITSLEQNQSLSNQNLGSLASSALTSFAELKTLASALSETTASIRSELSNTKENLTELHTHIKSKQEIERQTAESIRRLEAVIAGTQSKGEAGENVLQAVFNNLPAEWRAENIKLNNKTVEFALKLPNQLYLPIDSKWPATNALEKFANSASEQEKQRLKKEIEDEVFKKAKEIEKYIDPNLTVNFGVIVVPDAVYQLCGSVQVKVFESNVVLINYSMFLPYLLLVFQTILKTSQSIDLQKLDAYLQTVQQSVNLMTDEVEGRFSRSITSLSNSRDQMRNILSKINTSLAGLRSGTLPTENNSLPGAGADHAHPSAA